MGKGEKWKCLFFFGILFITESDRDLPGWQRGGGEKHPCKSLGLFESRKITPHFCCLSVESYFGYDLKLAMQLKNVRRKLHLLIARTKAMRLWVNHDWALRWDPWKRWKGGLECLGLCVLTPLISSRRSSRDLSPRIWLDIFLNGPNCQRNLRPSGSTYKRLHLPVHQTLLHWQIFTTVIVRSVLIKDSLLEGLQRTICRYIYLSKFPRKNCLWWCPFH